MKVSTSESGNVDVDFWTILADTRFEIVFTFKNHYWFWCPLLGSVLGMLFGTLAYDSLIYTGDDSIVNKPWVFDRVLTDRWTSTDRDVYRSARSTNSAKQSPRVQVQRVGKHVDAFPMSEFA